MSYYSLNFKKMNLDKYIESAKNFDLYFDRYTLDDKKSYAHKFLKIFPDFINETVTLSDHQWAILDRSLPKILKTEIDYWDNQYGKGCYPIQDPLKLVFKIETLARRSLTRLSKDFKPILIRSSNKEAVVSYAAIKRHDGEDGPLFCMINSQNSKDGQGKSLFVDLRHEGSWNTIRDLFLSLDDHFPYLDLGDDWENFSELFDFAVIYQIKKLQQDLMMTAIGQIKPDAVPSRLKGGPKRCFELILKAYEAYKEFVEQDFFFTFFDVYLEQCSTYKELLTHEIKEHLITLYKDRKDVLINITATASDT